MMPDLITTQHLCRKAVIYIRQSTPHQVVSNQESLRLQYALHQRAGDLGWDTGNIEVIDADLGQSAAAAAHRAGFRDLLARVTLGEVGIILSYEVTRLARNCSDWYPLLDICGYRQCLIGDRDGVYDPGSANGRLLLGLKGTLSEMELHTLRGRLTAGLRSKAERGELALLLPAGLEREANGVVTKDSNQEVQDRIALIFSAFLELGSVGKVIRSLRDRLLTVPRRDRFGDIVWRVPTASMLTGILKNPAYAGAFVYGRTQSCHARYANGKLMTTRRPMTEWKIVVKDRYPAYLDWQRYVRIQTMLSDNHAEYQRNQTRGVPRDGAAVLQGIAWCGQCGHKMSVEYKNGNRYVCNFLVRSQGGALCQHLPADPIDARVVEAFFAAVGPVELAAWMQAKDARQQAEEAFVRAEEQQIKRLRYQALHKLLVLGSAIESAMGRSESSKMPATNAFCFQIRPRRSPHCKTSNPACGTISTLLNPQTNEGINMIDRKFHLHRRSPRQPGRKIRSACASHGRYAPDAIPRLQTRPRPGPRRSQRAVSRSLDD